MKTPKPHCKCAHCTECFIPDYRSRTRQRFCSKPECRKASRRHSQKAWLAKPENQDYFRDAEHAADVRKWQQAHPGYWKNTRRSRRRTLQDACLEQVAVAEELAVTSPDRTLQDLCSMQLPLFVGLISMLTDSTLQDHIVTTTGRLVARGYDILGVVPGMKPERSLHEKTCPQSGTTPESARAI